jgi:hypothetical protein
LKGTFQNNLIVFNRVKVATEKELKVAVREE